MKGYLCFLCLKTTHNKLGKDRSWPHKACLCLKSEN